MSAGEKWSREEAILAMGLYLRTPFGKMHARNPDIINLAGKIHRTPSAVSLKMVNLAALDPTLDRKGMGNYGKLDKEIMEQFLEDSEAVIQEISSAAEKYSLESISGDDHKAVPPAAEDSYALAKTRPVQAFFRQMILTSYDNTCAITGIDMPELLIASHIVPWAHRKETRADPRNGICLNALHDKAFDRGLLTFDNSYRVMLSDRLSLKTREIFSRCDRKKIASPEKFLPSLKFIYYHRKNIFLS